MLIPIYNHHIIDYKITIIGAGAVSVIWWVTFWVILHIVSIYPLNVPYISLISQSQNNKMAVTCA